MPEEPLQTYSSSGTFCHLQIITWASALSIVSILIALGGWFPDYDSRLAGVFLLLPVLIPYGFIPLRLYRRRFRIGLTLAMAMGSAIFVADFLLIRFALAWDRRWWILGNLILLLAMQSVLLLATIKPYAQLPRKERTPRKWLGSVAYGSFLLVVFSLCYSPIPSHIRENENAAIGYLAHAAVNAGSGGINHEGIYPEASRYFELNSDQKCTEVSNLPGLVPHQPNLPAGYGLPKGYTFEYRGTQTIKTEGGCTLFKGFTINARPTSFRVTGIKSYFVDERLDIHFTSENRSATVDDQAVSAFDEELLGHRDFD